MVVVVGGGMTGARGATRVTGVKGMTRMTRVRGVTRVMGVTTVMGNIWKRIHGGAERQKWKRRTRKRRRDNII